MSAAKNIFKLSVLSVVLYSFLKKKTKATATIKTTTTVKQNTTITVPPTVIIPPTPSNPVDFVIRAFQTCREGGVKFRFQAVSKVDGSILSGVSWNIQNVENSVQIVTGNDFFVGQNNGGGTTRANVTATREGISHTRQFWGNSCNHDGQSTDCPDNVNTVTATSYNINVGSQITLNWSGTLLYNEGQQLFWFGDNFTEVSKTNNTVTIIVNQFPFWIQAQPNPVASNNYCHGWTGLYFS